MFTPNHLHLLVKGQILESTKSTEELNLRRSSSGAQRATALLRLSDRGLADLRSSLGLGLLFPTRRFCRWCRR